MTTSDSELQDKARRILNAIAFIPFEQCQPLTRDFESIPARPGIYALRATEPPYNVQIPTEM